MTEATIETIKATIIQSNPGDLLIFQFPDRLRPEALARLSKGLKDTIGGRNSVMILDGGNKIDVAVIPTEKSAGAAQ